MKVSKKTRTTLNAISSKYKIKLQYQRSRWDTGSPYIIKTTDKHCFKFLLVMANLNENGWKVQKPGRLYGDRLTMRFLTPDYEFIEFQWGI